MKVSCRSADSVCMDYFPYH